MSDPINNTVTIKYYDSKPPEEFVEEMRQWMIKHGPDRHSDGHEIIATLAWRWMEHYNDNQ